MGFHERQRFDLTPNRNQFGTLQAGIKEEWIRYPEKDGIRHARGQTGQKRPPDTIGLDASSTMIVPSIPVWRVHV